MITIRAYSYAFYFLILLLAHSCAPKVSVKSLTKTSPVNKSSVLQHESTIEIMYEGEPLPVTALELGQVQVSDNGFSVNCDLLSVID
ncbi:MAG: hypothetical protein M3Q05_01720, partial [Bacteroidota bacterium]|nr:hypothetical protein [Bacteroidota bacterium]